MRHAYRHGAEDMSAGYGCHGTAATLPFEKAVTDHCRACGYDAAPYQNLDLDFHSHARTAAESLIAKIDAGQVESLGGRRVTAPSLSGSSTPPVNSSNATALAAPNLTALVAPSAALPRRGAMQMLAAARARSPRDKRSAVTQRRWPTATQALVAEGSSGMAESSDMAEGSSGMAEGSSGMAEGGEREDQIASAPNPMLIGIATPRPPPSSPVPTPPGGWWYESGSPETVQRRLKAYRQGRWAGELSGIAEGPTVVQAHTVQGATSVGNTAPKCLP